MKTIRYFLKYWPIALLSVAALTMECLCDLWQPTMLAGMINDGVARQDPEMIRYFALRMLLATCAGMLFALTRCVLSSHVSQRFGRDMRLGLYKKIQDMSLENVDQFERATLITRLTNDVTQVQNFLNGMMRFFMRAPILCVGGVFMAYSLSPRMGRALFIVVPISVLIIFLSIKIGYPFFYKVQDQLDRLNASVREYLSGVRVVKAFNRFAFEKKRFETSNEQLARASASAVQVMAIFSPAIALCVNMGIVATLWISGNLSEEQGNIIAFVNYMNQILFSLTMFSMIFNQLVRALVSGRRMEAVLASETGVTLSGDIQLSEPAREIAYNGVTFQYKNTASPVLTDISFTINRGETVGIIGSTGSGKSTLVNLLPRFYEVKDGSITLNGQNVLSLNLKALRDLIAVVPQTNVLFSGTIADNLKWGKHDATKDEMFAALSAAQADRFVNSFPEGLNTMLGQGGVNLSGGQKQRLSIARALIKRPGILILDDSTSAVDVTTEAKIRKSLQAFAADMTVLMISQRISSVMSLGKIIVLDQGRITGIGTHDALIESCEVYRDIYRAQIGEGALKHG